VRWPDKTAGKGRQKGWEHRFVELFGYFSAIGKVTKKKIN